LDAGGIENRALILQNGNYAMSQQQLNANVHLLARSGASQIFKAPPLQQISGAIGQAEIQKAGESDPRNTQGAKRYSLPVNLETSQNPRVSDLAKAVQNADTSARNVMRDAAEAARAAARREDKDAIMSEAETRRKQLQDSAVNYLLEMEQLATGDEKLAVRFELAQRYRDAANFELAVKYYRLVADTTDQEYLKIDALRLADRYSQQLSKKRPQ
jgi:hypothetical protein